LFIFCALAFSCIACAGCASSPVNGDESGRKLEASGVRKDLSGMEEKALRELCAQYISRGNVFLYAEPDTDTPVVPKGEILFALQFMTVPLSGGNNEALIFNRRMLEYMHLALSRRKCPEHRGISLLPVPVKYGLPSEREMSLERKGKLAVGPRKKPAKAPQEGFVCPVDSRKFIPYNSTLTSP
jgi:hypothetical protein